MADWFTVEAIHKDTFAISEYKHWEETHCYLICGMQRAVLIDTGLGIGNIKSVVDSLTPLPVMVVTTHVHWNHIGGHKYFENIVVHEPDRKYLFSGYLIYEGSLDAFYPSTDRRRWLTTICGGLLFPQAGRKILGKRGT